MKNLSLLFYKKYFEGIDYRYLLNVKPVIPESVIDIIKKRNKEILAERLFVIPRNELTNKCITAKISYPGLITGVGINHETGIDGELKLGMHFDYSYGMPVIYGSSVKGVLRSAFPSDKDKVSKKASKIKQILDYLGGEYNNIDVFKLRDAIFEGKSVTAIPIYERDIFFDSVIIRPDEKSRILETDSITPHGSNPLKNPIPLTFLKIASGAEIEFRFRLSDCVIDGIKISADTKLNLFRKILEDYGIGAKTNVGYGQLSDVRCCN